MKKTSSKSVRDSLTLACCTLLHTATDAQAELMEDIDIDTAVLYYSESDGRVSLIEPVVKMRSELDEDEFVSLQLVFDTLTGASPNGAQASNIAQTFTSPSGMRTYTTPAGELPLDDFFRDSRLAITGSYEKPIDRLSKNIWTANFSKEFDWLSMGGGYTYSQDFNQRSTTLTAGIGLAIDNIDPIGGAPIPLSEMAPPGSPQPKEADESRNTVDFLVGVTQVLSRKTITQFNFGISQSDGYHTDPFKIVSEINDATGQPNGTYYHESRPDSRQRTTLYWKTAHHLTEDVINFTYRYYTDDWGVDAHTMDLKYRYRLTARDYLQPHIRYYSQTAADFYRHSLLASEALPEYVSADLRLGEFDTITYGIKYGRVLGKNNEISGRIEFMQQSGESNPADAIGEQQNHDLYPDLDAIILQFSYSFIW